MGKEMGMSKDIKIFISSRFYEFREIRAKIKEEKFSNLQSIGLKLNMLDNREGIADARSPAMASIEEASNSDIFVLLLGETYKEVLDSEKSYTHLEYETAIKKGLHILAFPIGDCYNPTNLQLSTHPLFGAFQKSVLENNNHITGSYFPTNYNVDELYQKIYKTVEEYINVLIHKGLVADGNSKKKKSTVNQQIHLPKHIIPKVLTHQTGLANDIDFVGRKEELQKVDELLNQNSMLLLLNGIGGIGKSTLASYYLNQKKDEFDYYGFVQVNEDIKLSLASAFSTSLDLKPKKIDDLFSEIMNKLQNLEGKKLLIIDDVKEMDNQLDEMNTLMTLKNSGFQILFTSREVKENIPQYFLDIMSVEDARELFLKHYATDEMDKVDKILEYLDYHALFIEITAKTLTKRKRTLSLDKMIEKFTNGEFSSIKKNKNESFNQFLNDLFADDKILQDEETLLFLKRLSVLPSIEISFEDLYKFLVCGDEEKLEEFLNELVDNGWLIESNGGYKFHQILKEFVFDNYLASFEEIEIQVDFFLKILGHGTDGLVSINDKNNIIYFESLVKLFNNIHSKNEKIITFLGNLGNLFFHLGKYTKSELLYLQSLDLAKKIFGEEHLSIASLYNNLGGFYNIMGIYEKSEYFLLLGLEVLVKTLGEDHTDTAILYSNLGDTYVSMGIYDKAEFLQLKALNIQQKVYGKNHVNIAISYNSIGEFYRTLKNYEKSEYFYLKALQLFQELLEVNHPNLGNNYHSLGGLYFLMQDFKKSEYFYMEALKIRELLPLSHPSRATLYSNLALLYKRVSDFDKALFYINKAIKIWNKVLPNTHINLINSKKILEEIKKELEVKNNILEGR
jgi:tetratricopeptide (TPR) repeat protein